MASCRIFFEVEFLNSIGYMIPEMNKLKDTKYLLSDIVMKILMSLTVPQKFLTSSYVAILKTMFQDILKIMLKLEKSFAINFSRYILHILPPSVDENEHIFSIECQSYMYIQDSYRFLFFLQVLLQFKTD